MTELENKVAALKEEMAAAKAEAVAAKEAASGFEQKMSDKDTEINNLDASVKAQQAEIEALKLSLTSREAKTAAQEIREQLEAKKEELKAAFERKAQRFEMTIEVKTDPAPIGTGNVSPNNRLSVADDPSIYAARPVANAFLAAFGVQARTANKLGWIEGADNPVVDYVAELAQNSNLSDVSFSEKTRAFGKLATKMKLSTEFEDWFEQLYNYCVNEGVRMIDNKLDNEVAVGAGDDSTYPNKVYGLVGQSTAFSAIASHAVPAATIADVILDAAAQIAKEGFSANAAFMGWADYRALQSVKDTAGNYIFDQARSQMAGIRIYPTTRLSSGALLVADTSAAKIYAGNSYELEFIRDGAYDAYDVYFRKAAQTKVPTANKKGLIYASSISTAIAALDSGSGPAADLSTIATKVGTIATNSANIKDNSTAITGINTAVTKLAGAVNESDQIETHANS